MLDLENLEHYREDNRLEAKKATGGLPESIWETYSAFANTQGGVILLGVEEWEDKSLHTVDLLNPEDLVEEFWTLLNDPKIASVNLLSAEDVRIEEVAGDHIVVIHVPRAPQGQLVYVGGDPVRGAYFRRGEGDYRFLAEKANLSE